MITKHPLTEGWCWVGGSSVRNSACASTLNAFPGRMLFICITVIYCDDSTTPTDNTALLQIQGITEGRKQEGGQTSVRGMMIPQTVMTKCWRGLSHDLILTDKSVRVLNERGSSWADMKMQCWTSIEKCPHDWICEFLSACVCEEGLFMWAGPSAERRCPEEEGPAHSTPSAARPWRGGWGRAGGRQTLPGADWEGSTRRCPGQRSGSRPVDTEGHRAEHRGEGMRNTSGTKTRSLLQQIVLIYSQ